MHMCNVVLGRKFDCKRPEMSQSIKMSFSYGGRVSKAKQSFLASQNCWIKKNQMTGVLSNDSAL